MTGLVFFFFFYLFFFSLVVFFCFCPLASAAFFACH